MRMMMMMMMGGWRVTLTFNDPPAAVHPHNNQRISGLDPSEVTVTSATTQPIAVNSTDTSQPPACAVSGGACNTTTGRACCDRGQACGSGGTCSPIVIKACNPVCSSTDFCNKAVYPPACQLNATAAAALFNSSAVSLRVSITVGSPADHSPELEAGLIAAYLAAINGSMTAGGSAWLVSGVSTPAVPGPGRVYSFVFYLQGVL
jgi:hypothetical protein